MEVNGSNLTFLTQNMYEKEVIRLKDGKIPLSKFPQTCKSVLCNSAIRGFFLFQNNPKYLDPSSKTDLDFRDCLGRKHAFFLTK